MCVYSTIGIDEITCVKLLMTPSRLLSASRKLSCPIFQNGTSPPSLAPSFLILFISLLSRLEEVSLLLGVMVPSQLITTMFIVIPFLCFLAAGMSQLGG